MIPGFTVEERAGLAAADRKLNLVARIICAEEAIECGDGGLALAVLRDLEDELASAIAERRAA